MSIELEHAIGAYELVKDCDVVHDNTLAGPIYSARYPGLPVVTTNHNPFSRTYNAVYGAAVPRVALVAISQSHASSTHLPVDAVVHHGINVDDYPFGAGDGGYVALLGRMTENKGVHRAIAVARAAGMRLKIAAKMREPHERRLLRGVRRATPRRRRHLSRRGRCRRQTSNCLRRRRRC